MALPKNKKAPKPKPKKKAAPRFGAHPAGTAYEGVDTNMVRRLAQSTANEELRDLKNQRALVDAESNNQTAATRARYDRGRGDLEYVNGEVTDFLQSNQRKNDQNFKQERSQQEAATRALQQSLSSTYNSASDGASAELARLGIQGGGNLSGLQADAANAQTLAQVSGSNALSSMDLASGNANQLSSMLQGMAAGSHVANIGKNLNTFNDNVSKIRQNKSDRHNEIDRAVRDTRAKRSDNYLQLLQQLQQTGYNQFITAKQNKVGRFAPKKK